MTNIGFFGGLSRGSVLTASVEGKLCQATLTALVIGAGTGSAQSLVLNRNGIPGLQWILATTIGWATGILIAGTIIFGLEPSILRDDFFRWILPSALIAGGVVGVPQSLVLGQRFPSRHLRWIVISTVGWAIMFPGLFPGYFLMTWIRSAGACNEAQTQR